MKSETWYKIETFVYLMVAVALYGLQYMAWDGTYKDSDNYFHVLRVMGLIENPTYWEQVFFYTNYPFGEILHWTRALDIFLLGFTLPLLSIFPLKTAAFYGGLLVTPFLGVCAVYFLLRGGRLILRWNYRILAAILFLVQANVTRAIVFNRPDHHSLFVFLSAFIFWKMVEFAKLNNLKSLNWVAIATAFSLWTAAEGVFLAVVAFVFLVYGYLFLGYSYQRLLRFAYIYAGGVILCWLANPPYEGFWHIDTGRLSLFYVCLAVSVVGILYVTQKIENKWKHIGAMGMLVIGLISFLWWLGWLESPLDERIIPLFVARISEMAEGNIYTLAYPVLGIFLGAMMFNQLKNDGAFIYLFLSAVLYGGLSFYTFRFVPYAGVYAALIAALFVQDILLKKQCKVLFATGCVLLEYVSFIIYALMGNVTLPPVLVIPLEYIQSLPRGTVATDLFFAPQMIWTGGHRVIASPYHRNVEGIIDNHQIFHSTDEKEVLRLIRKHRVDYVFLADGLKEESDYYVAPEKNCDKLYGKILGCGNVPDWLVPLEAPAGYLYRVDVK
ncbi:MAG: hypothetical protein NC218_06840 [Acetobacter sp.]|nr:hypothetical protein [Acetobacter sp.]